MESIRDLQDRIGKLHEYISLTKRLESIVEPKDRETLVTARKTLDSWELYYKNSADLILKSEQMERKIEESRELWVQRNANLFGGEESARKYFDAPTKNPKRKAFSALIGAIKYRVLTYIASPFSRELSDVFFEGYQSQLNLRRSYMRLDKAQKEKQTASDQKVQACSDLEVGEARIAQNLGTDFGLDERMVSKIIDRPEILIYAAVEQVKAKYASWL